MASRAKRRKLDLLSWLYDSRCFWCGHAFKGGPLSSFGLSIDELHPTSRGGMRIISNQVPAHRHCNMRRGDQIAPADAFDRHHAVLRAAGIEH